MDLYVELETLKLVTSVTDRREIRSINVKRGDALPLTVRFLQNQTLTRLDATTVITFALKESGKYDDDPVVLEQSFTASTVETPDSDPHYTADPSLNTSELSALFSIDDDSSNDPASVTLMGELTWTATGDTGPTSINTFSVVCQNDVYRGDEGLPDVVGNVPGIAASYPFTLVTGSGAGNQTGSITIDGWVLNLFNTTGTGSGAAGPLLSWDTDYSWEVIFDQVARVINGLAPDDLDFTLTNDPGEHPTVSAVSSTDGANSVLTLTAKNAGVAGNSISFDFVDSPGGTLSVLGESLSGGVDARNFVQDDFVSTLEDTLTTGQKAQAIANLIEAGSLNAGDADLETEGSGHGLILESPDGARWRVTVDNAGTLSTASI